MTARAAQGLSLTAATLGAGLMAGLFAAFSYAVMPAFARSSDGTFVEGMWWINEVIMNGWFLIPYMGTLPLLLLSAVLAWRGHGRAALIWIVAAALLYLVAFMVTMVVHMPLNSALVQAGAAGPDVAAVRGAFEAPWVGANTVRAVLHTLAFACLAWALVLYGGARAGAQFGAGRGQAAAAERR